MATSKNLKIRECDLDEALVRVIYGYKEALQRDFVNTVNSAINKLQTEKQDKKDMSHYFNKDTEKIKKSDIDPSYTNELDTRIDAKVPYSKLEKNLQDRIVRYEDNATTALSKANNMQSDINGLKSFKTSADNEINSIWVQITGLNDRIAALTGGSGGSSSSAQITVLVDDMNTLRARVDNLQNSLSSVSVTNIKKSQLSEDLINYLSNIETKANSASTPDLVIPNAQPGMLACIGGDEITGKDPLGNDIHTIGKLKPAYMLLSGRIAETDAETSSLISQSADWIFCVYKDQILIRKDQISSFFEECVTGSYNSNYYYVSAAFTDSWMANNKFIYDQDTGKLNYASDGEMIKVVDPKEMADMMSQLSTFKEDIKTLKNYSTEIKNIKDDIKDMQDDIDDINTDLSSIVSRITALEKKVNGTGTSGSGSSGGGH